MFPTTVDWTVSGGGTIDVSSGVFTATTVGGPFTVTATSIDDGTISGTADVTVVDSVPVPPGNLALGQPAVASSQEKAQYVPCKMPWTGMGRLAGRASIRIRSGFTWTLERSIPLTMWC